MAVLFLEWKAGRNAKLTCCYQAIALKTLAGLQVSDTIATSRAIARQHRESKCLCIGRSADRCRLSVSDFRAIQSVWNPIHAGRRFPVVDQPIPARGRGLSVRGSGAAAGRAAASESVCVPRRLRRTGDWAGARIRNLGEDCQCLRVIPYACAAVLFQLPRRSSSSLAVFRSLARSFCARPLLSHLHWEPERRGSLYKEVGIGSQDSRTWCCTR